MPKITAIVPTFNEEKKLERCLKSLNWADELIVVDSFSTDGTLEIARKYADKVLEHEYGYSAAQKNWTIPQAEHEWIFLLDADEYATDELIAEVKACVTSEPKEWGFWIKRRNFFMGKRIKYSNMQTDAVVRLFRKECRYEDKQVHAEIIADGPIGWLKEEIVHDTYNGIKGYLKKVQRYSIWGARDRMQKVEKVTAFHLFVKPAFTFFKAYILKKGFMDGLHGYVIACIAAHSTFLRYVMLWRMKHGEEIED